MGTAGAVSMARGHPESLVSGRVMVPISFDRRPRRGSGGSTNDGDRCFMSGTPAASRDVQWAGDRFMPATQPRDDLVQGSPVRGKPPTDAAARRSPESEEHGGRSSDPSAGGRVRRGLRARIGSARWCWLPAIVFLLGIASLIMLVWTDRLSQHERSYFAFANAVMDLRTKVAASHLWLEEAITGYDSKDMDKAWFEVRQAIYLTEIIKRGGEIEYGLTVEPTTDPEFLRLVEDVRHLLSKWESHFHERVEKREIAGIGSELERITDQLFDDFLKLTGDMEDQVETRLESYHASSRVLFLGIVVSWFGIVSVSVASLTHRERKRRQAEEALHRANDMLETRVAERTRDLSELNEKLSVELDARRRVEAALRESETQLRQLSVRLLTVQEAERRQIAAELHDALGHSLVLAKLGVGYVRRALRKDPAAVSQGCDDLARSIDQVIEEVRRLARDLRPAVLDDLGLSRALRWLIDNHGRDGRTAVGSSIPDLDDLFSRDAQVILYRVVQEAFTNVEKHAADATSVSLSVERHDDRVCFIVTDDGRGFDVERALTMESSDSGCGLATMDERARMLGGSLAVSSAEGRGTRVTLSVPLKGGAYR
jgi:signal transduction histidine kinase